jgi:glycosyltransferase involved in cell wall biosynthesis
VRRALIVALHLPHLHAYGGGERYLFVLGEVARERGHETVLIAPERPDPAGLELLGVRWEGEVLPAETDDAVTRNSAGADLFVASTVDVPPRSAARRSAAMVQFPHAARDRAAWRARAALARTLRRGRLRENLASYDLFLAYSRFAAEHVRRRLGVPAEVLAPASEVPGHEPRAEREPAALAVGRFAPGDHDKRHDLLVAAAGHVQTRPFVLRLVGGATPEDGERVGALRRLAAGRPVEVLANLPRAELRAHYDGDALFWHAAGHGVDVRRHPERVEHFGLVIVEAWARGAVPLVFPAGGPAELVRDGEDGLWWREPEELAALSDELLADAPRRAQLAAAGRARAHAFTRARFAERAVALLGL